MDKSISPFSQAIRFTFKKRKVQLAFFILFSLTLFAFLTPLFATHSYFEMDLDKKNMGFSLKYLLGTDDLGRDLFVRLAMGTRISLIIGFLAAILDVLVGLWYGAIAAFFGGKVENVMMRILDVLETIPYFLIVIGLMVILEPGLAAILLALCLVSWIPTARIIRAQILKTKAQDYILSARVLGASSLRILWKHLLPNAIGPLLVTMTLTVPLAIFTEAILSFLGLGLQTPMSSLGTLCSDGLELIQTDPKQLFLPAFLIIALMVSFTFIGECLNEGFNPKEGLNANH